MDKPRRFFPLDRIEELEAEIAAGLEAASLWDRRDAIAAALGLHGLRVGEVCGARAEDFRPEHRRLFVRTLKRGKTRDLTLHDSLVAALGRWRVQISARLRHQPVWLLSSRRGNRLNPQRPQRCATAIFRRLLGPKHQLTFHSLRHTFGMWLYRETHDIILCKAKLGHASVKTTEEFYVINQADVPEQCLVRLDGTRLLPAGRNIAGSQLRLFDPAAG